MPVDHDKSDTVSKSGLAPPPTATGAVAATPATADSALSRLRQQASGLDVLQLDPGSASFTLMAAARDGIIFECRQSMAAFFLCCRRYAAAQNPRLPEEIQHYVLSRLDRTDYVWNFHNLRPRGNHVLQPSPRVPSAATPPQQQPLERNKKQTRAATTRKINQLKQAVAASKLQIAAILQDHLAAEKKWGAMQQRYSKASEVHADLQRQNNVLHAKHEEQRQGYANRVAEYDAELSRKTLALDCERGGHAKTHVRYEPDDLELVCCQFLVFAKQGESSLCQHLHCRTQEHANCDGWCNAIFMEL